MRHSLLNELAESINKIERDTKVGIACSTFAPVDREFNLEVYAPYIEGEWQGV